MITDLLSSLVGYLLLFAVILFFINQWWLEKYALYLGVLVWKSIEILAAVIFIITFLIYLVVKSGIKFGIGAIALLIVGFIFAFSSMVSIIGLGGIRADNLLERYVDRSSLVSEAANLRQLLVETQTEISDISPRFGSAEKYREEFEQVKIRSKNRLQTGEWILSVLIGGTLLLLQLEGVRLLQREVFSLTIGLSIQILLFFLTLSITYRAGILDLIAFDGDEDFSSKRELDAAYSYQRMVTLSDRGAFATFGIVLVKYLSSVNIGSLSMAFEDYFVEDMSLLETLRATWQRNEGNDGDEEDKETEVKVVEEDESE